MTYGDGDAVLGMQGEKTMGVVYQWTCCSRGIGVIFREGLGGRSGEIFLGGDEGFVIG